MKTVSARGHLLVGLFAASIGAVLMLSAIDIGFFSSKDINGPPWIGFAAGAVFFLGGLSLMARNSPALNAVLGWLALVGLAAIANWVAFGAGERACISSFFFFGFWKSGNLDGLACRIPFGYGALIVNAFVCYGSAALLQKMLGGPPRLGRTLKMAQWLMIACLSPLLLAALLVVACGIGVTALGTRVRTGAWPPGNGVAEKAGRVLGRSRLNR